MYEIPRITMTMLGATGSGKTTYLHGMYDTLSTGVNGYFLYATDPDKDLDLAEAWEELCEAGTLPDATATEPVDYEFVFRHGMTTLLEIDCQDFRGGAGTERLGKPESPEDIAKLRARLDISDTIILALDGQHVARWVADNTPAGLSRAHDPMKIARFSKAISTVCVKRLEAEEPTPAIVVLLTKADLLGKLSGKPIKEALEAVKRNLFKLVQVLGSEGVTVMLCPVQIGAFDGANLSTVDPGQVNPKNLHKPITFALMHYLTEIIPRRQELISSMDRGLDAQSSELAGLRGGFMDGIFHRGRISAVESSMATDRSARGELAAQVAEARKRAEQMADDLRTSPIYRSGKLQEA
ncbi:hypothetical protein [Streptomyces sp. NPDC002889]|uniref:hypothetical protein n=1 Tax=Streptomyces sp. NPDC002889 TaxID=3364669 RepID=UPI00369E0CA2